MLLAWLFNRYFSLCHFMGKSVNSAAAFCTFFTEIFMLLKFPEFYYQNNIFIVNIFWLFISVCTIIQYRLLPASKHQLLEWRARHRNDNSQCNAERKLQTLEANRVKCTIQASEVLLVGWAGTVARNPYGKLVKAQLSMDCWLYYEVTRQAFFL